MAKQPGSFVGVLIDEANFRTLIKELNAYEPGLRTVMQKDLKNRLNPVVKNIASKVPGSAPLSGFAPGNGNSPYIWRKPRSTVKTTFAARAKEPGAVSAIFFQFADSRPNAGLAIMEFAGQARVGKNRGGLTPQGAAMIRNLDARYPIRGLGRFVLPEAQKVRGQAVDIVTKVLREYAAKVGRRLK
jgi:histone H3/H4